MKQPTKQFPLEDAQYEARRMTPAVAAYLWHRLQAGVLKVQSNFSSGAAEEPPTAEDEEVKRRLKDATPEERLRTVCGMAFLAWTAEDFDTAQKACMKVLSRYENGVPMPVMSDAGQWVAKDLCEDPFLVTKLMVEVLVFNLVGFLSERASTPTA